MNLKKVLAEFLKEEPRRSGRLEALRFVRRYAHGTRPMTHYRLQGPAVDAVPLLLRKAGLEDNRDFKVEKSAASDRTAKLWWLNGPVAGEFLAACVVESAAGKSGLTSIEEAYFAAYSRASDDDIVAKVSDTTVEMDVAAPARRDTGVTRLIAEQSKAIRAGIIKVLTADPEAACTLSANAKAFCREILVSCQHGENRGEFMPPLATLEFYVRIILGRTLAGMPADLVFAPVFDFHTVTRPIAKGEQVPVSHLMDAPLFETTETEGGNPMEGYFSNLAETVLKSADGHPGVLAVVNAPLTCGSSEASNQVQAAEFAFISRSSFWDYVKWIYREAYRGLHVELTSHHSMGVHSSSAAYGDYVVSSEDEDPLAGHISRADSRFWTATAMFALVIMKQAPVRPPWAGPQYSIPDISVLRGTQQTPDLGGNHVRESELAAEWFMMTHVGADPLPKKGSWYYYRLTAEDRESQLRAFRSYVSDLVSNPRVIGVQCSVAGNSYLHPSLENESATFTPMSSLVSGVIGAVKYWYGATLDVPLTGWDGQDPRGCHTEGVLVSAVYSGMWGDFSASAADSDRTAFPVLHGYSLSEILDSGFRSDERLAFTKLIDRLSSGDFLDQVTAAGCSDRCSLVLETNVCADAFRDRVLADPEQAKTMVRKLQFLFVDSVVYRDETPFKVLNGEAVKIDTNRLQDVIAALAADHVRISDVLGDSPTFNVADVADRFVSVSFREDSFGRLYIVFTATGDAMELARLMYRRYCGFHPASEKVAATRWTAPDSDRTVYVSDERSYDSACEVIRKAIRNLGGPLDFDDNDSRVVSGRIRPLVSRRMIGVSLNEAPTRNWFLSANAGDYTPSIDVHMP